MGNSLEGTETRVRPVGAMKMGPVGQTQKGTGARTCHVRTGRLVRQQSRVSTGQWEGGQCVALSSAISSQEGQNHRRGSWRSKGMILLLTLNLGILCWEVAPPLKCEEQQWGAVFRAGSAISGLEPSPVPCLFYRWNSTWPPSSVYTVPMAILALERHG